MRTMWPRVVQWLLALALPVCLLVVNLRIVAGHWFVHWEYGKASFPADTYGFSVAERTYLAEICVDYLATSAGLSLLGNAQLSDGSSAFNARELSHMADVKYVYSRMMLAGVVAWVTLVGGVGALFGLGHRWRVPAGLLGGSLLALGLLGAVGVFMLVNWSNFFIAFHGVFFEGDSWLFDYSDTLIRLFPMPFWIDIAAVVVSLLLIETVLIGVVAWIWRRRLRLEVL